MKIVQITTHYDKQQEEILYALTDTGEIHAGWWEDHKFIWRQKLPPLPEGENGSSRSTHKKRPK